MKKNKQPRNIKFNKFSILNLSFGLNVWFVLEKLGLIAFKSISTLFLTAIVVFLLRAGFDLLLAFFRQKLRSKNTKRCDWTESAKSDGWGVFGPVYNIIAVSIFFIIAITKLEWLSTSNPVALTMMTSIAFEQYWYFYNNPSTP